MKTILKGMISTIAVFAIPLAIPLSARADSIQAYCQYFPNGASLAKVSMPCVFSMRQGFIDIIWEDGVRDSFQPKRDRPYVYTDDRGGIVYQQRGEEQADGTSARIFKMENGSIYIWGS